MLDRLKKLWVERPAVIAASVIAPVAFVVTLLILFLVVGNGDQAPHQQQAAELDAQPTTEEQQQATATRQANVVEIEVKTGDQSQQAQDDPSAAEDPGSREQPQSESTQTEPAQSEQSDAQSSAVSDISESDQQDSKPRPPTEVAGRPVVPLSSVIEDDLDEQSLKHGTDGLEGGILPIDNGVVVSSRPEDQTRWELIVPSASLKSAIVRVGRTPSGAMGAPDNPYVIGWLDSSAAPGESGNTLLAGHRDFEDLSGNIGTGVCWELVSTQPGDHVLVRDNEQGIYYVYTVTETATVDPRDQDSARYLWNTDQPVITLITCTGSFNADTHQYSHRLVVVAELAAVASVDA
ncbi:MAG: sortase [Chloroflexota bacterium]|nr:sortase [Chloroflexota bacterium]